MKRSIQTFSFVLDNNVKSMSKNITIPFVPSHMRIIQCTNSGSTSVVIADYTTHVIRANTVSHQSSFIASFNNIYGSSLSHSEHSLFQLNVSSNSFTQIFDVFTIIGTEIFQPYAGFTQSLNLIVEYISFEDVNKIEIKKEDFKNYIVSHLKNISEKLSDQLKELKKSIQTIPVQTIPVQTIQPII